METEVRDQSILVEQLAKISFEANNELDEAQKKLCDLENHLKDNSNPKALKRLPKFVASIQEKLLTILSRRGVEKIDFQGIFSAFNSDRSAICISDPGHFVPDLHSSYFAGSPEFNLTICALSDMAQLEDSMKILLSNPLHKPPAWLIFRAILCVWFWLFGITLLGQQPFAQMHHQQSHPHHGHHKAHHGGVLNVIGKCEIGHVEVRVVKDLIEVWFVGGGGDTDRSVPVQAEAVVLNVKISEEREQTLLLKADPMKLAGEKIGYCSRFSARANWLKAIARFEAHGEILFKGIRRPLVIKFPEGYHPGHGIE